MRGYRNILMAIDFSKPSDRAFGHALELAKAFRARVRAVHVVALYESAYFEHIGATRKRDAEPKLRARLEALVKKLVGRSRVRCTAELAWGEPAEVLVNLAKEGPCDVVVIGARGLNPWESLVLGSVAEKVVRHAPVPVLVINTPRVKGGAAKRLTRAKRA